MKLFAPARFSPIIPMIAMVTGCSGMQTNTITIQGVTYGFPDSHVEAILQDQGHIFIRLHPADSNYKLLLNTRSDRKQRETGDLIISGVSDQFGQFEHIPTVVGTVVCKEAPHWSCGFEVVDKGVRWSVVFDRDHLRNVKELKDAALSALSSYRV